MAGLGVFGGTFDPPHLGHLILASEAFDQLRLDRVLWVVTPHPPHKETLGISSLSDRLGMVQAAIADNPDFELSEVEMERPGPHYAVDTVAHLRISYPGQDLIYLMGADSLMDLPDWHRPRDFVQASDALGVMRRPGEVVDLSALETILPGLTARVRFVEAPLLEISSSAIRRRVANGRPVRYYLPSPVFEIIQDRNLYSSFL